MTKFKIVFGVVIAVVVGVGIYGAYQYPQIPASFGSPVGTTFNTAKIVSVNMSPATIGATSTSVLNTDASARFIANYEMAGCTGVGTSQTITTGAGLAALTVQAATTSVPNEGLQGNTNYAMNLTVSTSTTFVNSSTSTPSVLAGYWAPNIYMTFDFNATNTAACTIEMDYIGS